MKDRLDKLDLVLRGDVATWVSIDFGDEELHLVVDKALAQANTTTNIMKQTIAAMRLPDANGKRAPAPRTAGAYVKGGKVSSLDRARQRGA